MPDKLIKLKKELEDENLEVFSKKYDSSFNIITNFFDREYSIRAEVIKDVFLSFIHREREKDIVKNNRQIYNFFLSLRFVCFFEVLIFSAIKFFTSLNVVKTTDDDMKNYLFINRGSSYFYDEIISKINKKKINISFTDSNELSIFSPQVNIKINRKAIINFIVDFRSSYKVIKRINVNQRFFFLKSLYGVILAERFYKSRSHFDYIFDSKDNSYLPYQKSLANLFNIQIVLMQNGGRVNMKNYGYISCNIFLGWTPLHKKIIVGGVSCNNFLSIGSTSLSRNNNESFKNNKFFFAMYDLLIVEQMSLNFSEKANYLNHKDFMDKIIQFKFNNPQINIAYLCRWDRQNIPKKLSEFIKENDKNLDINNIVKIDREFCELAIKNSKVSIAIDSSIRVESCMIGRTGFTLQPGSFDFDWPSLLMPEKNSFFTDSQDTFENKLNLAIISSCKENIDTLHPSNSINDFIELIV